MKNKLKKIEPAFWVLLIVAAIMVIVAIKTTYGF